MGYHQGRPSIENDSLFEVEAKGTVARLDAARLGLRDAGKNGGAALSHVPGHGRREIAQRALDYLMSDGFVRTGQYVLDASARAWARLLVGASG